MGQSETVLSAQSAVGSRHYDQAPAMHARSDEGFTTLPIEDSSDLELVAAVVSRHDGAFTELYLRHHRSVVLSARMIVGNATESEDVAADVLFRFWLEPEKYDPSRGTLLSFLRVRAKSRSIDLIRAETARFCRERRVADDAGRLDTGVDSKVLALESMSLLRDALAQLPPHEREPIELAYFGGMTYVGVAQYLALREGTVKSRIRSGMERLRSIGRVPGVVNQQSTGTVDVARDRLKRSALHEQVSPR